MDARKLEICKAAYEYGSLSKASAALHSSQSALTQSLQSLEQELGVTLFNRTYKGVVLTEAGAKLYPLMKQALDALERVEQAAAEITHSTPIRIGIFPSIANTWLPEIIQSFQKTHPDITFTITVTTNALKSLLDEGAVDIAVGDQARLGDAHFTPLKKDPLYAVLPEGWVPEEDHEITQQALASMPFIMAPQNVLDAYLDEKPSDFITVDSNDDQILLSLIAEGVGATVISELNLQHVSPRVRVLNLVPHLDRIIGVTHSDYINKHTQQFLEFLIREIKEI